MKISNLIAASFLILFNISLYSQSNKVGKIEYSMISGKSTRSLEMWFTPQKCMYKIKTQYTLSNIKTYKSIEDSLLQAKDIEKFNNRPTQYWFAQVNSNIVTFSFFDNNNKAFCVNDTMQFIEWQIEKDTLTINQIQCQKASGTYNNLRYEAWFAPSIPISLAPRNYIGLPGLLIKISDQLTGKPILEMTKLNWPLTSFSDEEIKPCSGHPYISKQQMTKTINESNERIRQLLQSIKSKNQD